MESSAIMDRNSEEFKSMGIFGICREAYKVTLSRKKIFSQIALFLLLPLAYIIPMQSEVSIRLAKMILPSLQTVGISKYADEPQAQNLLELITLYASKAICWVFLYAFVLLDASTVACTVACIYSSKDITFKNAFRWSASRRVWIRVTITFLWNFLIQVVCNVITALVFILSAILVYYYLAKIHVDSTIALKVVRIVFDIIPYFIVTIYLSLLGNLASVIAMLEDIRGIKAINKGKNLLRGKILWISIATYVTLLVCFEGTMSVFNSMVLHGEDLATVGRVSLGLLCPALMAVILHFGMVIQTIIYFISKSRREEIIDESGPVDHLGGDYVPLSSNANDQLGGDSLV